MTSGGAIGAEQTAATSNLRKLRDPDPQVRLASLQAMPDGWHIGSDLAPLFIGELQDLLVDSSDAVRLEALLRLTEYGGEQWIAYRSIVIEALRGASVQDRTALVRRMRSSIESAGDRWHTGLFYGFGLLKDGIPLEMRGPIVEWLVHLADSTARPPDNLGFEGINTLVAIAEVIPPQMIGDVARAMEGWTRLSDRGYSNWGWTGLSALFAELPMESRERLAERFTVELLAPSGDRWMAVVGGIPNWAASVPPAKRDEVVRRLRDLVSESRHDAAYRWQAAEALSLLPWKRSTEEVAEDLACFQRILETQGGILMLDCFARHLRSVPPKARTPMVQKVGDAIVAQDPRERDWSLLCAWVPLRHFLSERQAESLVDALLRQHHRGIGSASAAPSLAQMGRKIPVARRLAVVDTLVATATTDRNPDRVAGALGALSELADLVPPDRRTRLLQFVCERPAGEDFAVLARTASLLGVLGRSAPPDLLEAAVSRLIELTANDADFVQQRAISALGRVAPKVPGPMRASVLDRLKAAARSPRPITRKRAENALRVFEKAGSQSLGGPQVAR